VVDVAEDRPGQRVPVVPREQVEYLDEQRIRQRRPPHGR
jgi:hypothetical protein